VIISISYWGIKAPTPANKLRQRPSSDQQGLSLPQSYYNGAEKRQKFVMKTGLSESEKSSHYQGRLQTNF
jgi:phycobilisome core-membrane linker protein